MTGPSSLERRMLTYFGLIAAASLLITLEFVWAINAAVPKTEATDQYVSPAATVEMVQKRLETLEEKAALMCVVQVIVTLIVLLMFMRRITGPLQQMVEESKLISEGDLSRIIPVRSADELGMLADTINGLTSNIQEIVALSLTLGGEVREPLDELKTRASGDHRAMERLLDIEARIDGFDEMMRGFKLLPPPSTAQTRERS
jgi:methyl-accepting chemotaxis protein